MRSKEDVSDYSRRAEERIVYGCSKCSGVDFDCECRDRLEIAVAAYEACIPLDFIGAKVEDVTHNTNVFRGIVLKYVGNLNKALKNGYGLIFLGDNGVGKTYFMSFVLMAAIRAGRTAYYTTLPQLDYDIKRGFSDPSAQRRLSYMLTSDFLALDEMGKEQHKKKLDTSYLDTQVERILKQRCDDSFPMLLATNLGHEALLQSYGKTVASIMGGKFQVVTMKPGDYRERMAAAMSEDMGY